MPVPETIGGHGKKKKNYKKEAKKEKGREVKEK